MFRLWSWCLKNLCLGFLLQDCLEKFLQGTGGLHNRELLMVHYLQQANYIPALQLNHSLRVNLVVCHVHMCYHVFLLINTLSPCFLCKFLIHIFFKTRIFTQGIFTLSSLYITSHLHINTPTPLVSDCTQTFFCSSFCFSTSPLNHFFFYFQNERDPKLKERSNTRNSILDQYGKVLPRVQRKLAMERAKPYQHPYSIHREGKVELSLS